MTRCLLTARRVLGALAAIAVGGPVAAQPPGEAEPLPVGVPRDVVHRAEDRFAYVAELAADRSYLVTVEQRGLDLALELSRPDESTQRFDSPLKRNGSEVVLLEHPAPGRYAIALTSAEHTGAAVGHTIEVKELPAGTSQHALDAWRAMTEGAARNAQGDEAGWRAAAAAYEQAAAAWAAAGDDRAEALTLLAAAFVEFWDLYDWPRSADLAERAAGLASAVDAGLAASADEIRAAALVERGLEAASADGDGARSDELFETALALYAAARSEQDRLGNRYEVGSIVNNLGYVAYNRGRLDEARAFYEQAADLLHAEQEWGEELNPLANLAVLDAEEGRVAAAVDTFERVLAILPADKLLRYRGDTLFNLGMSYRMLGDIERSLQTFSAALEIQRGLDDLQGRGRSLRGIGETYYATGELELATQYLLEALALAEQTNDGRPQIGIYRTLGNIAALMGDYALALERHRQAVGFTTSPIDRTGLEVLIAKDLLALGRTAEAESTAEAAVASDAAQRSGLVLADALHALGRARFAASPADAEQATNDLERAEKIFATLDIADQQADVLHTLAAVEQARGDLAAASRYAAAAVSAFERLRVRVAEPELRATFGATRRAYYDTAIDVEMQRRAPSDATDEHLRAAFAVAERSRARLTADLLGEASVELRRDVDPATQARETELIEQLAERQQRRKRLLDRAPSAERDVELGDVLTELAAIENALNLLEIDLRAKSPRRAAVASATPLTLAEVQALLDDDTVLLEYALGERASYVWAVSAARVVAVELPDRATVEAAARGALDALRRPSSDARAAAPAAAVQRLAALVLAPVAPYLEGRVLLALDGALDYVPFGALPITRPDGTSAPLLAEHDVIGIPSMSTLAQLPPRKAAHSKTLAVIADPVVTRTDPRLADAPTVAAAAATPTDLLARSSLGSELGRLLSSDYEASRIAALVPADQRYVARGFDANRAALLAADLKPYRYIHFATHGLVDSRYPGLTALALSQFDAHGAPLNGFLRLHDIYDLDLDAEVVVLSACETALGRDIRGEGLVGLTQGFLYAGARSLVASLWEVPDRATAELMALFYDRLLTDGLPPATALRLAQTALASQRRWSDPYYWSGFVLVGDWR